MSETGIELDPQYAVRVQRVEAGVSLLGWLCVYAAALGGALLGMFL